MDGWIDWLAISTLTTNKNTAKIEWWTNSKRMILLDANFCFWDLLNNNNKSDIFFVCLFRLFTSSTHKAYYITTSFVGFSGTIFYLLKRMSNKKKCFTFRFFFVHNWKKTERKRASGAKRKWNGKKRKFFPEKERFWRKTFGKSNYNCCCFFFV